VVTLRPVTVVLVEMGRHRLLLVHPLPVLVVAGVVDVAVLVVLLALAAVALVLTMPLGQMAQPTLAAAVAVDQPVAELVVAALSLSVLHAL
jgi:hypothetical protein